jgi:hypothetical protein
LASYFINVKNHFSAANSFIEKAYIAANPVSLVKLRETAKTDAYRHYSSALWSGEIVMSLKQIATDIAFKEDYERLAFYLARVGLDNAKPLLVKFAATQLYKEGKIDRVAFSQLSEYKTGFRSNGNLRLFTNSGVSGYSPMELKLLEARIKKDVEELAKLLEADKDDLFSAMKLITKVGDFANAS